MAYRAAQRWTQTVRGGDGPIAEKFGIDPLIARILLNRGLTGDEEIRRFLHGTLEDLEDPRRLDQAPEAVRLIRSGVREGKKIRIIGDYDADGIFSVYILYHTLKRLGACVSYDVPDRVTDGFGMSMRLVEEAHRDGIDMIITCDNGIAQLQETWRAKTYGMTVIITDHHEPNYTRKENGEKEYQLPAADAVVDPKKPGCSYPNRNLCGAGVAWKLMYLLENAPSADSSGRLKAVRECPIAMEHLPFAAAATITDIMQLTGENRILVKEGLKMLSGTDNAGMRALIRCCGLEGKALTAGHIGFVLGPCMNASGRLDTAKLAIDLLLEENPQEASRLAQKLKELNDARKQMTEDGKRDALDLIGHSDLINDRVLILYLKGIHESVAGIIASKVKETWHRPVIVFTDTEQPDHLKGSGRSIEAYNMHDELSKLSDLFLRFGGHPMAAGVTIRRESLEALRRKINENCSLTPEDLTQKVTLDAVLPLPYLSEDLIRELSVLEPFGPGNSAPLFGVSQARLLKLQVRGKNRNCIHLLIEKDGYRMTAVYFGDSDDFLFYLKEKGGERETARLIAGRESTLTLSLAYRPVVNEFRSERSIQLQIANYQ